MSEIEANNSDNLKPHSDTENSFKNLAQGQPGPFEFKDIRQEPVPAEPIVTRESIGERLKKARLEKGVDFNKIYEVTKIRRAYIEALENNDFKNLPNMLVARGYMKVYADFLGLNVTEFVDQFNELFPEEATGSNGPRNPKEQETKFSIFMPKEMLVPTSLRSMNGNSFRYSLENKFRANKKMAYSFGLAAGFVFLAILLSNVYFKSTISAIKTTPRQESEITPLQAKVTPEMLQVRQKFNKVTVQAKGIGRTYVMVVMDGRLVFRGNLDNDNSKYWEADQYIRIKASVPRNLELIVNGENPVRMSEAMNMEEKTFYPLKEQPAETAQQEELPQTMEAQPANVENNPAPVPPQPATAVYSEIKTEIKTDSGTEKLFTF